MIYTTSVIRPQTPPFCALRQQNCDMSRFHQFHKTGLVSQMDHTDSLKLIRNQFLIQRMDHALILKY